MKTGPIWWIVGIYGWNPPITNKGFDILSQQYRGTEQ